MSSPKDKLREQLSPYLDGELSDAEAAEVARAVKADGALAAELASLRKVRELVGSLPRASAPDDLAERVLDRVERGRLLDGASDQPARAHRPWVGWLATAAVMVIAVGAGIILTWKLSTNNFAEMHGKAGPAAASGDRTGETSSGDLAAGPTDGKWVAGRGGNGSLSARRGGRGRLGSIEGLNLKGLDGEYRSGTPVRNFYMNTDNLVLAKADVERVLASNGIVPEDRAGASGERAGAGGTLRANVYNRTTAAADRVEYEVAVKPEQMREVFRQLNSIRRAQNVSQVPVVSPMDETLRKDDSAMADALEDIAQTLADMDRAGDTHGAPDAAAKHANLPKAAGGEDEIASALTPKHATGRRAMKEMTRNLPPTRPAAADSGQATPAETQAMAQARAAGSTPPTARPSVEPKTGETARIDAGAAAANAPLPARAVRPAGPREPSGRQGDVSRIAKVDAPAEEQASPATDMFLGYAYDRVANELKKRQESPEAAPRPAQAEAPSQHAFADQTAGTGMFEGQGRSATTRGSAPTTQSLDVLTAPAPATQGQWARDARLLRLRIILNEAPSK